MDFKDYYQILGVKDDAPKDEIKRSFKKLARKYHPDVSSEPDAQAKFQEVSEAYEILKDDEKRAEYDQLKDYVKHGNSDQGFQFKQHSFEPGTGYDDILSAIFGEQAFGRRGFGNQGFGGQGFGDGGFNRAGRDLHYKLQVSMEEARQGASRQIKLRTDTGDKTINVKVPAGISDGKELRLKGQGETGQSTAGDLYLQIEIAHHPLFELDGDNIIHVLPVSPWEAALGDTLEVPTLDGKVKLKIPANSQNGARLRLKGKGITASSDQYVVLKIVNPVVSNDTQREAFEALRDSFKTFSARSGAKS